MRPPLFVKELRGAYVGRDKGFALAPQIDDVKYMTYDALRPRIEIETPERIEDEPVIILGGNPNLGHQLFEFLTRLAVLDRFGYIKEGGLPIIFWPEVPERYLDLVRECVPNEVRHGSPAFFRYAFIPSCPVGRLDGQIFVWPDCSQWLRHRLRKRYGNRRIYAMRDSQKRKCLNEDEVRKALEARGIETIDLMPHSLTEQINIVSETELFVSAPGPGASLVMFADSGAGAVLISNGILRGGLGWEVWCHHHGNYSARIDGVPRGETIDADYEINIERLLRGIDFVESARA